ncbi:MAG: pilus assembly protein [Pigmentiphaga sp.]|uniref:TadE/TadG family type IV pilus assembly protein n=1 Tax=Pigmentiphaga sp. TaxID=1977564 RepID=UPI0029A60900|nr:TadE/TadG family type IV pilus assembly protein [Pigmentiphaga sp.]MDX3907735.1 pilus assembly protein [Pigmentiphaga sp.]
MRSNSAVDGTVGLRANGRRRQDGVYALEFALIFPIFFALFYGVLSFGLIFTVQQSLTLAAEDGARASLRYFLPPAAPGAASLEQQLLGRLQHGCDVAMARASWLGQAGVASSGPACTAMVEGPCVRPDGSVDSSSRCTIQLGGAAGVAAVGCGSAASEQCSAILHISYPYGAHPLVPTLPGMALLVPRVLAAKTSVTLDPGTLQLAAAGGGI